MLRKTFRIKKIGITGHAVWRSRQRGIAKSMVELKTKAGFALKHGTRRDINSVIYLNTVYAFDNVKKNKPNLVTVFNLKKV